MEGPIDPYMLDAEIASLIRSIRKFSMEDTNKGQMMKAELNQIIHDYEIEKEPSLLENWLPGIPSYPIIGDYPVVTTSGTGSIYSGNTWQTPIDTSVRWQPIRTN